MEFLRSKSNKKAHEASSELMDVKKNLEQNIHTVLGDTYNVLAPTKITPSLLADIDIKHLFDDKMNTLGGKSLIAKVVSNPTYDTSTLLARQNLSLALPDTTSVTLQKLAETEKDVLWLFGLPAIRDQWIVQTIFPQWTFLKLINFIPSVLALYHIFRGYIAPMTNIAYPLSTIFGPYIYIRKTLKWNLRLSAYLGMLKLILRQLVRPAATIQATIIRYITLFMYVFMFIYGVVQSFDISAVVRQLVYNLKQKLKNVRDFVATSQTLISSLPNYLITAYVPNNENIDVSDLLSINIPNNLSGMYSLWTDTRLRRKIQQLVYLVSSLDVANTSKTLASQSGWCRASYGSTTSFLAMGHPLLIKQVRNPFRLDKNLIITGPNAAGKTTYMKAVCSNIVLAQTIGIACASNATVNVVHSIGSFIRVGDSVGRDSLFEAEAKRCSEMLQEAKQISENHQRALYFLDEPMHSTPPIEGAATAMAVVKHLGTMIGIRVFVTTHYHNMTSLEEEFGDTFLNISMEAKNSKGVFKFPYRIRRGPSYQCIAIDLLKEKGFDTVLIDTAIEMKNKICQTVVDK